MIFPCFLTSTDRVSRRTTCSSTLLSFLKAIAVIVPMTLKKTITAGTNCRKKINVPMMMKIQGTVPCPLKVIDLANAGEVIRVINPIINPTIGPILVFFNYYLRSFVFNLTSTFLVSFDATKKNPQISCFEFSAGLSGVQKGLFATSFIFFIYYSLLKSNKNRQSSNNPLKSIRKSI